MKFLVSSDDTGVVKEVICNRGTDTSKQDATQPISVKNFCTEPNCSRKNRIIHMINYQEKYLVAIRIGGELSVYEIADDEYEIEDEYKYNLLHNYKLEVSSSDKPISLFTVDILEAVAVAFSSGKVFFVNFNDDKFDKEPVLVQLPGGKEIAEFSKNPSVEGIFGYGGEENDVRIVKLYESDITSEIFDTENVENNFKSEVVFTAKNVKNDHLDLRVPVWITKIRFFTEQPEKGYKFITATHYGQIRVYDTNHGRRPVRDFTVCQKPILTLTFANEEESEVIISDLHNLIAKHSLIQVDDKASKTHSASAGDIIKPVAKLLGRFVDQFGATYGVEVGEGLLVTGGLDRYLRVFDLASREIVAKVYVGVEVSSVVVLDYEEEELQEEIVGDVELLKKLEKRKRTLPVVEREESDEEDLWNQLEEKDIKRKKS